MTAPLKRKDSSPNNERFILYWKIDDKCGCGLVEHVSFNMALNGNLNGFGSI